jgi:hypothetical protein
MLVTPSVVEIATDNPAVHAFEIRGGTRAEDIRAMARHMEWVFDEADKAGGGVSMLLRMRDYDMGDAYRSASFETLKAQMRSPWHIERYAVIGAPPAARAMIETMAPLMPVDARTFEPEQEAEAWAFVGASPR